MTRSTVFLGLAAAMMMIPGAASAGGWQEAHQTSDDVRIIVAPDGTAQVEHHLRWRVVAGKFKSLEITGIDPRAELVADTTATSDKGAMLTAHVEPNTKIPGTARIEFDEPKGIGRGSYVVDVKYKIDLVATKMLVPDGAMSLLTWTSSASPEGRDGARVVFVLPPAPTEPRLAAPEQAQTTLATLRRAADRDELELVRAHVPRGEEAAWAARVDAKAFTKLAAPPPVRPSVATVPEDDRTRMALTVVAFATMAGLLAYALGRKRVAVSLAAEARSATMRPLLKLPVPALAPFAYGLAGAASLAALLFGTPLHGALLAVLAMALAAHRAPVRKAGPRGPGRWSKVTDPTLTTLPAPADALDITTRKGMGVLFVVAVLLGLAAFLLRTKIPGSQIAIPIFASVLVPLFATGTRAQLPRSPSELAGNFFRPVRDALGRLVDLSHVELATIARVREGTSAIDEVRLSCAPSDAIPGLRTLEVALAEGQPEVLVRWTDRTAAAAKLAAIAPGIRIVPGRALDEKVLRLIPARPTPSAAAKLVAKLLSELEGRRRIDRRESPISYQGPERRLVPATA